jgi:hypothetical protein
LFPLHSWHCYVQTESNTLCARGIGGKRLFEGNGRDTRWIVSDFVKALNDATEVKMAWVSGCYGGWERTLHKYFFPKLSLAPYLLSLAPYLLSLAPYLLSLSPYLLRLAPYLLRLAPYLLSLPPYLLSLAPYLLSLAPYLLSLAPYLLSLAPYLLSLAPCLLSLAPYFRNRGYQSRWTTGVAGDQVPGIYVRLILSECQSGLSRAIPFWRIIPLTLTITVENIL